MDILSIFSVWDIAVLIAAMMITQKAKLAVTETNPYVKWLRFSMPFVICAIGFATLVLLGEHLWKDVPALTFIVGGAGNMIYKVYKRVAKLGA